MYLFNIVMKEPELRCRSWGTRIRLRLSRVEAWAEKQGLELAAECHLARVTQAMNLLKGSKGRFLLGHFSRTLQVIFGQHGCPSAFSVLSG